MLAEWLFIFDEKISIKNYSIFKLWKFDMPEKRISE